MLSDATTMVAAPDAVMWTAARVAERDGISKQAVTKKVRDLAERHHLLVERNTLGAIVSFNVVQYDHLRGKLGDPSKAQAPRREAPLQAPANESYDEALRQKTWHEAEKRRLELAEIKGELVRKDMVEAALEQVCERIVHVIDRLPRAADEISAAVAKDGTHGARVHLKLLASRMREDIAAALAEMSQAAPVEDTSRSEEASAP